MKPPFVFNKQYPIQLKSLLKQTKKCCFLFWNFSFENQKFSQEGAYNREDGRGHWMKGSPSLFPPWSQGRGRGRFSKHFNDFRGRGELFQIGDKRVHSPITIIIRGWKGDNPRLSPFQGRGRARHFQWFCPLYFCVSYNLLQNASYFSRSWMKNEDFQVCFMNV